eukprot:TRINITY_DN91439_c0_g1_i1.p1 TRINITY_DN91439_c0_g1~~TRINITY_DN91439_c0_g1_i1.p1  ORF type:complete len:484 (-),score=112.11 TRINITY_DN91439_c0_g1_i1:41-1492(-)
MAGESKAPDVAGVTALRGEELDIEALQGRIMLEIQNKLAQKEESLWRRGQVEIKRLQEKQRETLATVSKMQEQQNVLITQNQEMRRTIVEVTSKFEQVVKQMRGVIRKLPQSQQTPPEGSQGQAMHPSPSPSDASTAASKEPVAPTPGMHTPLTMWHPGRGVTASGADLTGEAVPPPLAARGDSEKTFRTPPRGAATDDPYAAVGLQVPASWSYASASSPTALSLASALPSSTAAVGTPSPSPAKRLNLSEWLPDQQPSAARVDAMMATPTPPLPAGQSAKSSSTYPDTAAKSATQIVDVELVKETGFTTLGIEVNQDDGSLLVELIDEHGLVGSFNAKQEASGQSARVHVGDRIVAVNGVRGDPNLMLQECKNSQRLAMVLSRGGTKAKELPDAALPEAASAKASSPNPKLRPDAEVFVPSAQKEQITAPPGLERSAASSLLATSPSLPQAGLTAAASSASAASASVPGAAEDPEVKRTLFH